MEEERPKQFKPTSITAWQLKGVKDAREVGREEIEAVIKHWNDVEAANGYLEEYEESNCAYYEFLLLMLDSYEDIDVDKLEVSDGGGIKLC